MNCKRTTLALLLFIASSNAFTQSRVTQTLLTALNAQNDPTSTRRGWITEAATGLLGMYAVLDAPRPSYASVFVDPDRYGDKELKVATVNKLRQTIRNRILKEPTLAPLFVKVAMQDALTYDSSTQAGGQDGTIISAIIGKGAPPSLESLRPAAFALLDIAKEMKRTTEVTMADVVAFAGAEAIESTGGPRIVVQLGKLDPKPDSAGGTDSYLDLENKSNGKAVVDAFLQTGLTEREVALLFGVLGAMETVVSRVVQPKEVEQEENEMGDKDVFIPSSFGAPSSIYGKQLGAMDNSVFTSIKSDLKKGKQPISPVFTNEKVGDWGAKYYVDKKKAFFNDLPQAYEKLMALGTRYTGGKMGSLLGDDDAY